MRFQGMGKNCVSNTKIKNTGSLKKTSRMQVCVNTTIFAPAIPQRVRRHESPPLFRRIFQNTKLFGVKKTKIKLTFNNTRKLHLIMSQQVIC